jgi:hypothetical protein
MTQNSTEDLYTEAYDTPQNAPQTSSPDVGVSRYLPPQHLVQQHVESVKASGAQEVNGRGFDLFTPQSPHTASLFPIEDIDLDISRADSASKS